MLDGSFKLSKQRLTRLLKPALHTHEALSFVQYAWVNGAILYTHALARPLGAIFCCRLPFNFQTVLGPWRSRPLCYPNLLCHAWDGIGVQMSQLGTVHRRAGLGLNMGELGMGGAARGAQAQCVDAWRGLGG